MSEHCLKHPRRTEAGPCLLTRLRAAQAMTMAAGEFPPDAPTEAAVNLVVLLPAASAEADARGIDRSGAIVMRAVPQTEVRGAGRNAKVSAAARCSHRRRRGCRSRPSPMT